MKYKQNDAFQQRPYFLLMTFLKALVLQNLVLFFWENIVVLMLTFNSKSGKIIQIAFSWSISNIPWCHPNILRLFLLQFSANTSCMKSKHICLYLPFHDWWATPGRQRPKDFTCTRPCFTITQSSHQPRISHRRKSQRESFCHQTIVRLDLQPHFQPLWKNKTTCHSTERYNSLITIQRLYILNGDRQDHVHNVFILYISMILHIVRLHNYLRVK